MRGKSQEAINEGVCHTAAENREFYSSLTEQLKAPALAALREETAEYASVLRADYEANPEGWYIPYHFGWGMAIRNFLRQKGFGEEYFGTHNLDDIYIALVTEALELGKENAPQTT